jgi:hypothetical protein
VSRERLPRELLAFLREHINSLEQLEVLLLLRSSADRTWTPDEVSDELRTARTSVAARLADLARRGLVESVPGAAETFRFRPPNGSGDVVNLLATTYAQRRHAVIEAIFAQPVDGIRLFAAAFRFRGDDDEEEGRNG